MSKVLVIAEKPSVGKDIARVLKCNTRGDGYLSGEKYMITWAIGHLVALKDPDEIDPALKKWSFATLPILLDKIETKVLPKTKSQYSVIKKLMLSDEVASIICATDSGREGELIFRYIYDKVGCNKPVMRLWISSMTDQAINEGFAKLKPSSQYDNLYLSARCRSFADWLVGMNASRAFTLKFGVLLSVGRVQTPTLNIIVRRTKEIATFVPQTYWEILADFGDYTGLYLNPETNETRISDEKVAKAIVDSVKGKLATIKESTRQRKNTVAPQLYDLTTLQRDANRKLNLSAAKTLTVTQALYETHKLVTYPRTDSKYLSNDIIPKVKQAMEKLTEPYAAFAAPLLVNGNPPFTTRVYNDAKVSDHHAIIPTPMKANLAKLSKEEQGVYDLIVRRFLAAFYPDYEYESTKIITTCMGHNFVSRGNTPLIMGWRTLYANDKDESDEEEAKLPSVKEGDIRTLKSAKHKKKQTQPPKPLTDGSLLSAMENAGKEIEDDALREQMKDSGFGTPATRAATIERLIEVGYVIRKGKALFATEKGEKLIEVAPNEITSPETTGKWERALDRIAQPDDSSKTMTPDKFMESIKRYSAFLVESAKNSTLDVVFEAEERKKGTYPAHKSALNSTCPLCKEGKVTENEKAFGCTRWKEGCKFTIWKNTLTRNGGPMLTGDMIVSILGNVPVVQELGTITYDGGIVKFEKRE